MSDYIVNETHYLLNKLKFNIASDLSKLDASNEFFLEKNCNSNIYDPIYNFISTPCNELVNVLNIKFYTTIQAVILINLFSILNNYKDKANYLEIFNSILENVNNLYLSNNFSKKVLDILTKARIDIKNFGSENNAIELLQINEPDVKILSPKWFIDQSGKGYTITTCNKSLNIKFKCINNGHIKIYFKGDWYLDKNKKPIPIYINYINIIISKANKEEIIFNRCENIKTWHNKPLIIDFDVKNNDEYNISFDYLVDNYPIEQLINILDYLKIDTEQIKTLYNNIK